MNDPSVSIPVPIFDDEPRQQRYLALFYQARQRFNDYFLEYALDHRDDWPALEAEQVNLLAAAHCFWEVNAAPELFRLRDALQPYLDLQGYWSESLRLNDWAIVVAERSDDLLNVARFTHDRADILHQRGDYEQAGHLYQVSEQLFLHLGQPGTALKSRHMQALVRRAQGRWTDAERLCESVITEAQRQDLHTWLAHPLYVKALLARDRGHLDQARRCIEASLDRLAGSDELAMIAQCQHFLGDLTLRQGELVQARAWLTESLRLSEDVGILRRVATTRWRLGDVAQAEGNVTEADEWYVQAFELATRLGDRPQQARILLSRSRLAAGLGKPEVAIRYAHRTLVMYEGIGDPRGTVTTSFWLARLHWRQKEVKSALCYGLKSIRDARKMGWPGYSTILSAVKSRLTSG